MRDAFAKEIVLKMSCTEKWGCTGDEIISDDNLIQTFRDIEDFQWVDSDGRDLLVNAVLYEREALVDFLVNKGLNVNRADNSGFTPLHYAVQSGNLRIVEILLKHKADVNAKNMFGNSPIMMANLKFPLEGFNMLVMYGADPEQKNNYGVNARDIFLAYPDIISSLDIK